ncbi:MAG: dihydrofolate reductase family protein [Saprospiraceae bacterium]|nr:dihydrofolate reductase family protein [Saprospiraceae bacterium]
MATDRKVILYIATSLDGYIAKPNDDLGFLSMVEQDGGAEIVNQLLQYDLIDEFIISVIPILVGNGTKLWNDGRPEQKLELVSTKQFEKGLTQLHYRRARVQ